MTMRFLSGKLLLLNQITTLNIRKHGDPYLVGNNIYWSFFSKYKSQYKAMILRQNRKKLSECGIFYQKNDKNKNLEMTNDISAILYSVFQEMHRQIHNR